MPDRPRSGTKPPRRTRDLSVVESLRRHPDFDPTYIRTTTPNQLFPQGTVDLSNEHTQRVIEREAQQAIEAKRANRIARFNQTVSQITPETPVARTPGTVSPISGVLYEGSGPPLVDEKVNLVTPNDKRAQRMARFDETVAGVEMPDRRQDPSRAGGRRKLDVSEETVQRMANSKRPLASALDAQERMSREGGYLPRPAPYGRYPGEFLDPVWSRQHTLDMSDPNFNRKLDRLGYSLESSETYVPLPKHQRTIGSAQQFDWFDRAEPFERYEITRAAANQAGVGPNYTSDPAAYDKMRLVRDEMLAVDPRSDAEMRENGAKVRAQLQQNQALKSASRAQRAGRSLAQIASEEDWPAVARAAGRAGMSALQDIGGAAEKTILPLMAAHALVGAANAGAEGASPAEAAYAGLNKALPVNDLIQANRAALYNMSRKRGGFTPGDNSI